jgi:calcineurin-like phosphoesterase family protein
MSVDQYKRILIQYTLCESINNYQQIKYDKEEMYKQIYPFDTFNLE